MEREIERSPFLKQEVHAGVRPDGVLGVWRKEFNQNPETMMHGLT